MEPFAVGVITGRVYEDPQVDSVDGRDECILRLELTRERQGEQQVARFSIPVHGPLAQQAFDDLRVGDAARVTCWLSMKVMSDHPNAKPKLRLEAVDVLRDRDTAYLSARAYLCGQIAERVDVAKSRNGKHDLLRPDVLVARREADDKFPLCVFGETAIKLAGLLRRDTPVMVNAGLWVQTGETDEGFPWSRMDFEFPEIIPLDVRPEESPSAAHGQDARTERTMADEPRERAPERERADTGRQAASGTREERPREDPPAREERSRERTREPEAREPRKQEFAGDEGTGRQAASGTREERPRREREPEPAKAAAGSFDDDDTDPFAEA